MGNKSKLPPLWSLPFMLVQIPRLLWAQSRGDYHGAMKVGRQVMGSAKIKTRAFKGYVPTANDVFVCTYSKSGTYWMLQLVTQIAGRGAAEFDHIHDIVPWPEGTLPGPVRLNAPTWQDSPTQIRAVKTHAEANFIPYNRDAKYVIVIRDPKDALISSFYFSDSIMPGLSSIGLDAWTEAFIRGEIPYGIWAEHVAGFWPWRERDNVLVVMFSEMKRDLEKVARAVATLMEVQLSDAEVAMAVEKSSFAYMKAAEAKFEPPSPMVQEKVELLRNGKTGEAVEHLTPEQLATVDRTMKAQLQNFGSDFPYDEYFSSLTV
jgi:hypothetical protein